MNVSGQTPEPSAPLGRGSSSNLDQLIPVVLFVVLFNLVNILAAVVAATLWSVKAAVTRHRRGLGVGWWLPLVTGYLIVRATVTIAVERDWVEFPVSSEAVYFGIGFVTKFLIGIAVAVTILIGRPLVTWLLPKAIPLHPEVLADARYRSATANVSWIIVGYQLVSSVWDVWLFNNSGFNLFFLARSGVNFVVSFVCISVGLLYLDRRLDPIERYPGLAHLLDTVGKDPK